MEKTLTVEDCYPIFAQMEAVRWEAAELMNAGKLDGNQIIIIDRALGVISAVLRHE